MAEKTNIIALLTINFIMIQMVAMSMGFVNASNSGINLYNDTEANSTFITIINERYEPIEGLINTTYLNTTDTKTTEAENSGALDDIWDRYAGAYNAINKIATIIGLVMDATVPAVTLSRYLVNPLKNGFLKVFVWLVILGYNVVILSAWGRLIGGKNRL